MAKQNAKKARKESAPELREFVKEHDQRVYSFCYYLSAGQIPIEEIVINSFRDFGEELRRYRHTASNGGRAADWESLEQKLLLFRCAWERMDEALTSLSVGWLGGRDTRFLQAFDEDLLKAKASAKMLNSEEQDRILERLAKVPLEFRAPLVLRDMVGFTDEEVFQVLGLRWGVYRHRLHRGRLAMADSLRGRRPSPAEASPKA
jgi:DNA-directed RNA polymerase specialized sigma24 family protein